MKATAMLVTAALLLTACATTYQPSGYAGGFSEMPMAEGVYRITFSGNGFTRADSAQEMALLRAAELTLRDGYSHFVVMGAEDSTDTSYYYQPGTTTTTITPYGFNGYQAQTNTYGAFAAPINKPKTEIVIRMMGPGQGGIDAQQTYDRLAAKYKVQ